jgi:hypothetical protein
MHLKLSVDVAEKWFTLYWGAVYCGYGKSHQSQAPEAAKLHA